MNNSTGNFSEDMSKYIVTVPALHTVAAGFGVTLPPVTFVFNTRSQVTVTSVVVALQQYVAEHKVPHPYNEAHICTWLERNTDLDGELAHAFEYAMRKKHNLCSSLGYYLSNDQGMNLSRDVLNSLRIVWVEHCIAELLMLKDKEMTKEMNEKHNYKLLRPVKFKDVQVGDVLILKNSSPTSKSSVTYKSQDFVVLRFSDGSEGTHHESRLEIDYGLAPLCWVESKPVYPGDELYRPKVEEDQALVVSHVTIKDGIEYLYFSNFGDASEYVDNRRGYLTWTKPEQKPVPSFQVADQDVFPGDTVYYYGKQRSRWGVAMTVKEGGQVLNEKGCLYGAADYEQGAATFCLKPMLVIGEHLVPMPVRDAAEMEKGDCYYVPTLNTENGYIKCVWGNYSFNIELCDMGLMHRTKEAAIAHGEALIALSKKKD